MSECDYIFVCGPRTGEQCSVKCRAEGDSTRGRGLTDRSVATKCSKHKTREEYRQAIVNISKNEKQREYMRKRRADPAYKEAEMAYQREYCRKHGISYRELVRLIDYPAARKPIDNVQVPVVDAEPQ